MTSIAAGLFFVDFPLAFGEYCHGMFSLQRLLGKEDKFFNLLEASAEEARNSVHALVRFNQGLDRQATIDDLGLARRKDKELKQEINEAIYNTFVTAIEREDIEELASALYKIPKTVEKFTARVMLSPALVRGVDFTRQINLLEQATETIVQMLKTLRKGVNLEETRRLNDKLQQIENEADGAILDLYRELFSGKHDAIKVIVLKDLYELLEKVIDRCRNVGSVISHIVLKNS
jgi:uncharacterized protein Yka (UPF0111/DUF47 family)